MVPHKVAPPPTLVVKIGTKIANQWPGDRFGVQGIIMTIFTRGLT